MNKKIEIALLIVVALLAFIGAVYSVFAMNVSEVNYHSYTTAVCYGKICADFYVECLEGEVFSNVRISGWVTFGENWEDIRGEEKNDFCK